MTFLKPFVLLIAITFGAASIYSDIKTNPNDTHTHHAKQNANGTFEGTFKHAPPANTHLIRDHKYRVMPPFFPNKNSQPIIPGHTYWHANRQYPQVAITFDDGPKPEVTYELLNILQTFAVHATFFIVGNEAKKHPDIIQRIHAEGHDIANHTTQHPRLMHLSDDAIFDEIQSTNTIIQHITGSTPKFFRPPGGYSPKSLSEICKRLGLSIVMWDVNPGDYHPDHRGLDIPHEKHASKYAPYLIESVLQNVQNGSIILLHNGYEETLKALPIILTELEKKGFQCVRLSDLLIRK